MPTNFVLGFILMWLGKHEVRKNLDQLFTKPLLYSWAYSLFIFCPVTLWSFYKYPAWATVYLRPEFLIPDWAGPLIVFHYFLGMVFGSLLAQFLIQNNKKIGFWFVGVLGLVWLGSMALLTSDEYQHIGTYNEYHAGQAQLIFENQSFMLNLNIMGALIGGPFLALGFYLFKRSRRIQYIFRI